MKKLSFLSLVIVGFLALVFSLNGQAQTQEVDGWFKAGSTPTKYEIGIDDTSAFEGNKSTFLVSKKKKVEGFGTIMQSCSANNYLGRRIKMKAQVRTENVNRWAGLWLRVDAKSSKEVLSFDNMEDRPISGTSDWNTYEIVLNVPENSGTLNYELLLAGAGKVWLDDVQFEILGDIVPNEYLEKNKIPANLNFEGY